MFDEIAVEIHAREHVAQNCTKNNDQHIFLQEQTKLLTLIWYEPLALVRYLTHFTLW